jgi:hypothetical protein
MTPITIPSLEAAVLPTEQKGQPTAAILLKDRVSRQAGHGLCGRL